MANPSRKFLVLLLSVFFSFLYGLDHRVLRVRLIKISRRKNFELIQVKTQKIMQSSI